MWPNGYWAKTYWAGYYWPPISGTPPSPVDTRGGIDERHYKKYRKYLKELTRITSQEIKYSKKAVEAAEELSTLPVETEELQKLTEGPQLKGTMRLTPQINYEALKREISLINAYLDMLNMHRLNMLREQDDEAAFMLMIQ